MRIGILFGGRSREREISFAGGRTVYDLLDKSIFTPVPVFIDSLGNFILLDWQYLYKGSIRDFYPPVQFLEKYPSSYQVYIENLGLSAEEIEGAISHIGRRIRPEELASEIDFAFLALHGPYGEDGSIQGLLEYYDIPYSGSGILPSAIGIDKQIQKDLMEKMGMRTARSLAISRTEWLSGPEAQEEIFRRVQLRFEPAVVIKASTQGSSIGVSILQNWDFPVFQEKMNAAFFIRRISADSYLKLAGDEKRVYIQELCDIYLGIGAPLKAGDTFLRHPADVEKHLDNAFAAGEKEVQLESLHTEPRVLIEEFIKGREFSCIVVEGAKGEAIALPPTEIIKSSTIFDYRAKYLPGISRKVTPIDLPEEEVERIAAACENLYRSLQFDVYARIDGMIKEDGSIYLNDPNTTSGMMPSSFFFHQAAEIGLSPGQFLTYIIHKSLQKRLASGHTHYKVSALIFQLEEKLAHGRSGADNKSRIAVILGGYSTERHISVESGRNVYEKLSSSGKYNALPVLLTKDGDQFRYFVLPLNLLLKDNADDIAYKAMHYSMAPVVEKIIRKAEGITSAFASPDYAFFPRELSLTQLAQQVESVFIGLHGRPGEDGTLQRELEKLGLPYNGSGVESSATTIDKYKTNEILKAEGLLVPEHILIRREDWLQDKKELIARIERQISYPLIAKPSDDGCSSAVKRIKDRYELNLFIKGMFRDTEELSPVMREELGLKANEEFPKKDYFVVEELVDRKGADHFLEITGGMLTSKDASGNIVFEVFEPSEALASKGILSLEEKFLAGEGQNITPARFSPDPEKYRRISAQVRGTLEKAARALQVEGYCRIDAFVRIYGEDRAEVIFIEVNSLPGLTPATVIFHQAALNGYKPAEFLDRIIEYGKQKSEQREFTPAS